MSNYDILDALNDIDDACIKKAREEKNGNKKILAFVAAVAACFLLVLSVPVMINFFNVDDECGNSTGGSGNFDGSASVEYEAFTAAAGYTENEDIKNNALNRDLIYAEKHLPIYKFETLSEYNKFISDYSDILSTENLRKFNESYFLNNTLLLVYKSQSSGSFKYNAKKLDINNGRITVFVKQTNNPENGSDDMSGSFILISVEKHNLNGVTSFDAVFEK